MVFKDIILDTRYWILDARQSKNRETNLEKRASSIWHRAKRGYLAFFACIITGGMIKRAIATSPIMTPIHDSVKCHMTPPITINTIQQTIRIPKTLGIGMFTPHKIFYFIHNVIFKN